MNYWNILWKTFAQLAAAALLAVQGYSWVAENFNASAAATGWALLGAAIGAVLAVLWAFVTSPAVTPLQKALRSAAEKLAGALSGLAIADAADLIEASKLVIPTIVAVVLAFAITYFQNQDAPTPVNTTPA